MYRKSFASLFYEKAEFIIEIVAGERVIENMQSEVLKIHETLEKQISCHEM